MANGQSDGGGELGISGPGGVAISAKGAIVITVIMGLAVIAAQVYVGHRLEGAVTASTRVTRAEHASMRQSDQQLACVLMFDPAERRNLRQQLTGPQSFKVLCPWMDPP